MDVLFCFVNLHTNALKRHKSLQIIDLNITNKMSHILADSSVEFLPRFLYSFLSDLLLEVQYWVDDHWSLIRSVVWRWYHKTVLLVHAMEWFITLKNIAKFRWKLAMIQFSAHFRDHRGCIHMKLVSFCIGSLTLYYAKFWCQDQQFGLLAALQQWVCWVLQVQTSGLLAGKEERWSPDKRKAESKGCSAINKETHVYENTHSIGTYTGPLTPLHCTDGMW